MRLLPEQSGSGTIAGQTHHRHAVRATLTFCMLDWRREAQNFADCRQMEPTQPSKPSFVGFEGPLLPNSVKIESGRGQPAGRVRAR